MAQRGRGECSGSDVMRRTGTKFLLRRVLINNLTGSAARKRTGKFQGTASRYYCMGRMSSMKSLPGRGVLLWHPFIPVKWAPVFTTEVTVTVSIPVITGNSKGVMQDDDHYHKNKKNNCAGKKCRNYSM